MPPTLVNGRPGNDAACALCGEPIAASGPAALAHVADAERTWTMHVHESCVRALLAAGVSPLAADRPSGIPGDAACGSCGGRLPIVGRYPYALTIEAGGLSRTWFVHAGCLPQSMHAPM
jgi:hypothetical protein